MDSHRQNLADIKAMKAEIRVNNQRRNRVANITPAQLTAILRQMDFEACKSRRLASETSNLTHAFGYRRNELTMRKAMSIFVYGIGPENFEGKPFIDFCIPMKEEFS
jgi:hypothetical protein